MAARVGIGRAVVKPSAAGESARRAAAGADGKRRRRFPFPSVSVSPLPALARRAFSRLGHFSRETLRVVRPRDGFFLRLHRAGTPGSFAK